VFAVQWAQFVQHFASGRVPPVVAEITRQVQQSGQESQQLVKQPDLLRQLQEVAPSGRKEALMAYIHREAARILELSPLHQLDTQQGFFDMGMDSLMAVEFKSRLETDLGQLLPATLTFDYPNIEALSRYLLSKVGSVDGAVQTDDKIQKGAEARAGMVADIKQLSDDELAAFVDKELETLMRRDK
jgi:acyl carrier protein